MSLRADRGREDAFAVLPLLLQVKSEPGSGERLAGSCRQQRNPDQEIGAVPQDRARTTWGIPSCSWIPCAIDSPLGTVLGRRSGRQCLHYC